VIIDADYVDKYLNELSENEDLSRYILWLNQQNCVI
jgi:ATP-dependent protease HslVU (ClpYQ) ATPase subunit